MCLFIDSTRASLVAQMVKNLPVMQERWVPSLGQEDSSGEGNGNLLQYSFLENSVGRGAWWVTIYGVAESDTTEQLTHTHRCLGKVQTMPLHYFWGFHPLWQVLTSCSVSSLPCPRPPTLLLLSWCSELELPGDVQLPGHRRSLPTISTCLPCEEKWDWHWNFSHFFQSLPLWRTHSLPLSWPRKLFLLQFWD